MKQPARRIASALLLLLATALLASAARGGTAARVGAEPTASVRVEPLASRIDWSDGPFSVRIELSGLDHYGQVPYDDDRDTEPDRYEPSDGLAAFEIVLHFDPAVLEVTEAHAGDFLRSTGRSSHCFQRVLEPGQYAVGCVSTGLSPGPQGSGTLATITLLPLANGTSFLGLEGQLAGPLADSIPVTVDGGIVEVFGAPETTPTLETTPTPEPGGPVDGDDDYGPVEPLEPDFPPSPTPPEGDTGPGSPTAESDPFADGEFPSAGTGYEPRDATVRPLVLGGALAAAGAALLLLASRLAARARG